MKEQEFVNLVKIGEDVRLIASPTYRYYMGERYEPFPFEVECSFDSHKDFLILDDPTNATLNITGRRNIPVTITTISTKTNELVHETIRSMDLYSISLQFPYTKKFVLRKKEKEMKEVKENKEKYFVLFHNTTSMSWQDFDTYAECKECIEEDIAENDNTYSIAERGYTIIKGKEIDFFVEYEPKIYLKNEN